jgi:hypothetical protein
VPARSLILTAGLEAFLASHRVLSVDRRFVDEGETETGTHLMTVDLSVRDSSYSPRSGVRISGLPARDKRARLG